LDPPEHSKLPFTVHLVFSICKQSDDSHIPPRPKRPSHFQIDTAGSCARDFDVSTSTLEFLCIGEFSYLSIGADIWGIKLLLVVKIGVMTAHVESVCADHHAT
jgi:hypothetical protein